MGIIRHCKKQYALKIADGYTQGTHLNCFQNSQPESPIWVLSEDFMKEVFCHLNFTSEFKIDRQTT